MNLSFPKIIQTLGPRLRAGTWVMLALAFTALAMPAQAQTAQDIVRRLEANQVYATAKITGTITVTDRFGVKTNSFTSYSEGRDKMLVEFTSGEERGQKILRTKKEIYLYYPDSEEVIRLQGAALRESVLGSDVSYQDIAGDKSLLNDFTARLVGKETVDGAECFKLELVAKDRGEAYPRQELWVDATDYFTRRATYYSLSDRLLKELKTLDTMKVKGRVIASRSVMQDVIKGNSSTEFRIQTAELDTRLPPNIFSLEELSW